MSINCNSRGPSERDCAGIGSIRGPCTWYNQGYGCSCPNEVMFKSDPEDKSWNKMLFKDYVEKVILPGETNGDK